VPVAPFVVAAFEPFAGRARNRSWEVVRRLPARRGVRIVQLPVDFARLQDVIPRLMHPRPRGIVIVGEAPTDRVAVEQLALNIIDTDRPDNAGARPQAKTIVPRGPLALRASWDARALAAALTADGTRAAASFHAGTFACNAALYLALHEAAGRVPVGFLHVPYRRGANGVRMDALVRAVEAAVGALLVR